jgi:hypothetical protein
MEDHGLLLPAAEFISVYYVPQDVPAKM